MSKKRLYEIIYEVSRTVNSSLDPAEVLHRIAEQVTRAMNVKGCFIRLLDRSGKILKPAAYLESTSTKENPFLSTWFLKAFLIAALACMMYLGWESATRSM